MNFSVTQIEEIINMLSAILLLGNVSFIQAGGAQIGDNSVLDHLAELLGVESSTLGETLTNQTRHLRGEVITTPLDVQEVGQAAADKEHLDS